MHDIDLMQWLVGAPVKRLHAEIQRHAHLAYEDSFFGLAQFENGVNGLLDVSWLVPTQVRQTSVVGERGMFVVDTLTQELYFYENDYVIGSGLPGAPLLEGTMTKLRIEKKEPLRVELENFVGAVEKGQGQIVTGNEGLRNLDLALAFLQSAYDGKALNS